MAGPVLDKPDAFLDEFFRKPGTDKCSTTYCAGCGHGIAHKLIAETISDYGLTDRTIMVAPVGCAVFLYYYFKCCAVSVPHGRAPAALTGISRVHPESICISYQGDGDLGAIGIAEILHAANRGEQMVVFFVNNAIYGMTGGQMAPTTLTGMKTATSPLGRNVQTDGAPLRMAELINQFDAPVYIERVSLDSPKSVMQARKAVRKGLQVQVDKKGFAFVEILSPCPTHWKVSPVEAGAWIRDRMFPVFPPGLVRDRSDEVQPYLREKKELSPTQLLQLLGVDDAVEAEAPAFAKNTEMVRYKFAGFGGQGVLTQGSIVAQAGMESGFHVTWVPSYGPESRGGTSNCTVILSQKPIGCPVADELEVLMAMNGPSLERFLPDVVEGGLALYDSSLVEGFENPRPEVRVLGIPALKIAEGLGNPRGANAVMLGAYQEIAGIFAPECFTGAMATVFGKPKVAELNAAACQAGADFARRHMR